MWRQNLNCFAFTETFISIRISFYQVPQVVRGRRIRAVDSSVTFNDVRKSASGVTFNDVRKSASGDANGHKTTNTLDGQKPTTNNEIQQSTVINETTNSIEIEPG